MRKTLFIVFGLILVLACSTSKSALKHGFSKSEFELIKAADSLTPMRVYKITNKSDSILLRSKSTYIKPDPRNATLQKFINRLFATVRDSMSLGVGIAAPQVGVLKNIIWVQRFDKENFPFEVYLNPKIVEYSKVKQTVREGCLSIPNRTDTLSSRSKIIKIEYDTRNGEHKTESVEGFTSVIFQHEIDHLNGILYLDHLEKDLKDANN
ncbi:peptide deformylase [Seonamhaeicola marinus]|uniref:Peptide deformylase n=1 Tax=Seonamhaeicola marinus TaxID=1912246 RepID=A0A5D0HU27_9FLAO|nr:peptide deformylase [Seonamhaeicola marinus]TYA74864.1 peptide deformylase [Seonamhaeicola marinus]